MNACDHASLAILLDDIAKVWEWGSKTNLERLDIAMVDRRKIQLDRAINSCRRVESILTIHHLVDDRQHKIAPL